MGDSGVAPTNNLASASSMEDSRITSQNSPSPTIAAQSGEKIYDMAASDDEDESDSDDSVTLEGSIRASTDEDEDTAPTLCKKDGSLVKIASYYYANPGVLAQLFQISTSEMDLLLLENPDVVAIAQQHKKMVLEPAKEIMESGEKNKPQDRPAEWYANRLAGCEGIKSMMYSHPSHWDMQIWTTEDYVLRHTYQYTIELERLGVFKGNRFRVTRHNAFVWGYLLLKCREMLDTNDRKKSPGVGLGGCSYQACS